MRVLLINTNRKGDLLAAPPIGLCYVAGSAEKAGHQVELLDMCFTSGDFTGVINKALEGFRPQVVGLSVRNIDNVNMLHPISYLPDIVSMARYIRQKTSAVIVVGGSGASLVPERIIDALNADYIVVGDGEEAFVGLLEALESGVEPTDVPGVGKKTKEGFSLTKPKLKEFGLDRPDLGRWVKMEPYQKLGSAYNVQTKRGCPRHCIYCTYNQSLEGNRLRLRSPKDVVDEIDDALERFAPKTIEFVDSVFNEPLDHAGSILEELASRPRKTEFTAMGVHPTGLDNAFLKLMWRAGFRSFMITPESASDQMLSNYRKGFTKDQVVRAAEAINKTSFAAWWFFMIGGPGETNATLQESLDFALKYLQKNQREVTHIAHFFTGVRIYPGTRLWEIAVSEGYTSHDADPLNMLWYLSDLLDLDDAVESMTQAAAMCRNIPGIRRKSLVFSKIAASLFSFLNLPRPYWRYFRAANRLGLSAGIRFMFRPPDISGMLRKALMGQGYRGNLLNKPA